MILCQGIWAEAARTATAMRNYLVSCKSDKSLYEKFMGAKYDCIDILHTLPLLKTILLAVCELRSKIVVAQ
jgi:hypothetical protein